MPRNEPNTKKDPDDVIITITLRSSFTKAIKGGFRDTPLGRIVYSILKEFLHRSKLDPGLIEDICHGNVKLTSLNQVQDSGEAYFARAASLAAGILFTVGVSSVNRFCLSGLKTVEDIANQIHRGTINVGISVGAESISTQNGRIPVPRPFSEHILKTSDANNRMHPMAQTSENVSQAFSIDREAQNLYVTGSFRRAEHAHRMGLFEDEIVPITTSIRDDQTGTRRDVTLSKDEGIRAGTTYALLKKVRPAFPQYGQTTTSRDASQVSDGDT